MDNSVLTGTIFNVQPFTVHDGPGIRTELFMKGCSLNCEWCSNPEGIHAYREVAIYPDKCIGFDKCGWCEKSCKNGVPYMIYENKLVSIDRSKCKHCMACADACPSGGIKAWGKVYTVEEAFKLVKKDKAYYDQSGGGVTISGGESLLQADFVAELFKLCKEDGIGTCVETALNVPREAVDKVLPYADYWITDIKHMDTEVHKARTGADNTRILDNIKYLTDNNVKLVIRIPVIEGFNATEENIRATGKFIAEELGGKILQLQLLPYRKLGIEKYQSLNQSYPMGDYTGPEREVWETNLMRFRDILREYGLPAEAGTGNTIKE